MSLMQPTLFDFQAEAIPKIASLLVKYNSVLVVSPGGSGKATLASAITQRYESKQPYKTAFFTHRDELFDQIRNRMLSFGTFTQPINASTESIDSNTKAFVCMVETFNRRSQSPSFLEYFKDVRLCHYDEAHRSDFNKIFPFFDALNPKCKRIGWTATPISALKKRPLKDDWEVMIEIATIEQMQELNHNFPNMGTVPSELYHLGNVDRNKLKVKGLEFDDASNSEMFSKKEQIDNVIEGYFERGLKTLCFDVDVKHSKKMCEAFKYNNINARHLNGNDKKNYRKDCLEWLKHTPDAVLNNVGILTTGFDEPSVEAIYINSSMMSLSLYIQKMVRGSRPYFYTDGVRKGSYKERYLALDFGNNADFRGGNMGDCNRDIDWQDFFDNPNKQKREGIGGCKTCPVCKASNPIAARFCCGMKIDFLSEDLIECGYIFPVIEKEEDIIPREMVRFFQSNIDIKKNVKYFVEERGSSNGRVYYETLNQIAQMAFKDMQFSEVLLPEQVNFLLDFSIAKIKELGKISGKRTYKESVKADTVTALRKVGFLL